MGRDRDRMIPADVALGRGVKPDRIIGRKLVTHRAIIVNSTGVRTSITSHGSQDQRVSDFLRQFGELDGETLAHLLRQDTDMHDYLRKLVEQDLGVESLVDDLAAGRLQVEWSDASVRGEDGYSDVHDILYLVHAEQDRYRIVTVGYDNKNGDLSRKAFDEAVSWSRTIWENEESTP